MESWAKTLMSKPHGGTVSVWLRRRLVLFSVTSTTGPGVSALRVALTEVDTGRVNQFPLSLRIPWGP